MKPRYLITSLHIFIFVIFGLLFVVAGALAQGGPVPPPGGGPVPPPSSGGSFTLPNPLAPQGINTFDQVMQRIASIVTLIGLPIVSIMIIYAGFLFVSAGGSEEKIATAKKTFFWAVIGALLVVGAYAIATAISNFAQNLS